MDSNLLFTSALGLKAPWQVSDIRFDPDQGEIHFDLACESKRLDCPACAGLNQPIHDRVQRTWQHLHFFQYKAFLHAPLPRVKCGHCHKVTQVGVPWARPGSGFTLLMDALVLTLAKKLPVSAIAQLFGVSENRIWRAINVHVEAARAQASYADVKALGVDEKFVGRRLGYLTIFHDPLDPKTIGTVEGRKAETFEDFKEGFEAHEGQSDRIEFITMDMSRSFQAGARQQFPNAQICFDAFHVSKLVHDALDEVRRSEVKQDASLKGSRWALLKSAKDWSFQQITDMHWLQRSGLKTARAWRMKERYQEIHQQCRAGEDPEPLFRSWISWARRSRLEPFKRLGKTLKAHLPGILAAYRLGASNAVAENINSQIQAAIVRARGFQSLRSLTNIIFLTTGKLQNLPANPFAHAVTL
jgi:transposase